MPGEITQLFVKDIHLEEETLPNKVHEEKDQIEELKVELISMKKDCSFEV